MTFSVASVSVPDFTKIDKNRRCVSLNICRLFVMAANAVRPLRCYSVGLLQPQIIQFVHEIFSNCWVNCWVAVGRLLGRGLQLSARLFYERAIGGKEVWGTLGNRISSSFPYLVIFNCSILIISLTEYESSPIITIRFSTWVVLRWCLGGTWVFFLSLPLYNKTQPIQSRCRHEI